MPINNNNSLHLQLHVHSKPWYNINTQVSGGQTHTHIKGQPLVTK